jgi:hypothetical protein
MPSVVAAHCRVLSQDAPVNHVARFSRFGLNRLADVDQVLLDPSETTNHVRELFLHRDRYRPLRTTIGPLRWWTWLLWRMVEAHGSLIELESDLGRDLAQLVLEDADPLVLARDEELETVHPLFDRIEPSIHSVKSLMDLAQLIRQVLEAAADDDHEFLDLLLGAHSGHGDD